MACPSCRSGLGLLRGPAASSTLRQGLFAESTTTTTARAAALSFSQSSRTSSRRSTNLSQQQSRRIHTTRPCREGESGGGLAGGFRKLLASVAGNQSSSYIAYGATQRIYKDCAKQADYTITPEDRKAGRVKETADGEEIGTGNGSIWHQEFGLLPTFSTWAHVTMLHLYLVVVRLRCLDKDAHATWQAQLVDHFFHQAEEKMDRTHDMSSRVMRQRYLQDLFVQWRGVVLAYDEGLVKGDAVLAAAVWRNLFKGREDIDVRTLATIVSWMRNELKYLDFMEDAGLALHTTLFKSKPDAEFSVVDKLVPSLEKSGAAADVEGVAAAGEAEVKASSQKAAQKPKPTPKFKTAA
ncbi:ubiquinol-cytochrome C chaperone-domain-containing protein [Sordaria brevicollis]|uniref:Ubiquinol-cytochrome C chaperone-domain-containing protein n=1 Tax=Sordaria brevicollis TaxID=83679 RepID=A0AAE0NV34_SORBR|nr:ubiquinol-cytochrome C chaperone-domain-containing protein [Sordaria brevicollis]